MTYAKHVLSIAAISRNAIEADEFNSGMLSTPFLITNNSNNIELLGKVNDEFLLVDVTNVAE